MIIDYLRYTAYRGRLRGFFESAITNFAEWKHMTGSHVRFAPSVIQPFEHLFGSEYLRARRQVPYWRDPDPFYYIKRRLEINGGPDPLFAENFKIGDSPPVATYAERRSPPELQIVIDIDPTHWGQRYVEPRNYEGVPVLFRQVGVARPNLRSGDVILSQRSRHRFGKPGRGTLCGVFRTSDGKEYALTCGHVVGTTPASIWHERKSWIWKLPIWSAHVELGSTSWVSILSETQQQYVPGVERVIKTNMDAALIKLNSKNSSNARQSKSTRRAVLAPIARMLQEEPVWFTGAGWGQVRQSRITSIAVFKKVDLLKDNTLYVVGDLLGLGHRYPMYLSERVSRDGDSGAAVWQGDDHSGNWYGMIVCGDDAGAYAIYSEFISAWAVTKIGAGLDFLPEV